MKYMRNKNKSIEFIAGYVYSNIERKLITTLQDMGYYDFSDYTPTKDAVILQDSVLVPQCWFEKPLTLKERKIEINTAIIKALFQLNTHYYFKIEIEEYKQYYVFNYAVGKGRIPKKMTVEEIEKELGYKVEIIS